MDKEIFILLCDSLLGLILIPHKEFGVVPVEGGQAEREELVQWACMRRVHARRTTTGTAANEEAAGGMLWLETGPSSPTKSTKPRSVCVLVCVWGGWGMGEEHTHAHTHSLSI